MPRLRPTPTIREVGKPDAAALADAANYLIRLAAARIKAREEQVAPPDPPVDPPPANPPSSDGGPGPA